MFSFVALAAIISVSCHDMLVQQDSKTITHMITQDVISFCQNSVPRELKEILNCLLLSQLQHN